MMPNMGRQKGFAAEHLSKFGAFLTRHNLNRDAIAAPTGVTPSYISMLAHGKAQPGFRLAVSIENWTRQNLKDEAGNPSVFACTDWDQKKQGA